MIQVSKISQIGFSMHFPLYIDISNLCSLFFLFFITGITGAENEGKTATRAACKILTREHHGRVHPS